MLVVQWKWSRENKLFRKLKILFFFKKTNIFTTILNVFFSLYLYQNSGIVIYRVIATRRRAVRHHRWRRPTPQTPVYTWPAVQRSPTLTRRCCHSILVYVFVYLFQSWLFLSKKINLFLLLLSLLLGSWWSISNRYSSCMCCWRIVFSLFISSNNLFGSFLLQKPKMPKKIQNFHFLLSPLDRWYVVAKQHIRCKQRRCQAAKWCTVRGPRLVTALRRRLVPARRVKNTKKPVILLFVCLFVL